MLNSPSHPIPAAAAAAAASLRQAKRAKSRKARRTLGEEWMEHLIDRMEKEYTAELQVGGRAGVGNESSWGFRQRSAS
jgi:methylphosphotriester-DNA--protein-cysteine methyltransferase